MVISTKEVSWLAEPLIPQMQGCLSPVLCLSSALASGEAAGATSGPWRGVLSPCWRPSAGPCIPAPAGRGAPSSPGSSGERARGRPRRRSRSWCSRGQGSDLPSGTGSPRDMSCSQTCRLCLTLREILRPRDPCQARCISPGQPSVCPDAPKLSQLQEPNASLLGPASVAFMPCFSLGHHLALFCQAQTQPLLPTRYSIPAAARVASPLAEEAPGAWLTSLPRPASPTGGEHSAGLQRGKGAGLG